MNLEMLGRFWGKVNIQGPNECWNWVAALNKDGYGQFNCGLDSGYSFKAPRISWKLHFGEIPQGLNVLHRCDNRKCVNPNHLFLGTHQDNMDDKVFKGRQLKGESHRMAKLTDSQVLLIRSDSRPLKDVALDYGVSKGLISYIRNKKIWRHL